MDAIFELLPTWDDSDSTHRLTRSITAQLSRAPMASYRIQNQPIDLTNPFYFHLPKLLEELYKHPRPVLYLLAYNVSTACMLLTVSTWEIDLHAFINPIIQTHYRLA